MSSVQSVDKSPSPWRFWQFLDSAFPTGGFAHSGGLEAARQHGEISGRAGLEGWILTSLRQLAHASLPWVCTAHREPHRIHELDDLSDAFLTNHVANRASRLQGSALVLAADRALGARLPAGTAPLPFQHLAPLFGALCRHLEFPLANTAQGFVFIQLRGWIAAAVRLNIVGPLAGQAVQASVARHASEATALGLSLSLDDLAQTAPLLDLWQGTQDRLYSRLFQT